MANEDDFSMDNVPSSNWMKFSKVGDYVKGTFVEQSLKKGMGDFKDQQVYKLINCTTVIDGKKQNEKEFSVGISSNYVNSRFQHLVPGQIIGIKFEKEIPAKIKGHHPAKSLLPNVFGTDLTYKPTDGFKKDIDFE